MTRETNSDPAPQSRRHPLHYPQFRVYLFVRLCAIIATTGITIILAWQAYNIARETMAPAAAIARLGFIGLIQFVALFIVTPFSGLASDRLSRTRVANATLTVALACALLLAWGAHEGWLTLGIIYFVAAMLGLCRAFQGPALSSMAPNIVPPALLPRAIAFGSIAWQGGSIIGPAMAGYAYALTPFSAFSLCAALFLAALIGLRLVGAVPQAAPDRVRHPVRQIIDGLTYVRTNRLVLGAITLDLFAVFLAGTTALLPVFAKDIYGVGSQALGHLAAAPGIGALAMALWFSFRPMESNVGVKMLAAVIVFGLATIGFGLTAFLPASMAVPIAICCMMIWGGADMVSVYIRSSLIQLHTPDAMRGRVGSVSQLTISASNELGEAESSFLASIIGPVESVVVGGIGAIVVTLAWIRLFPELRLARSFDPPNVDANRTRVTGDPS
jgi:MFS family permease